AARVPPARHRRSRRSTTGSSNSTKRCDMRGPRAAPARTIGRSWWVRPRANGSFEAPIQAIEVAAPLALQIRLLKFRFAGEIGVEERFEFDDAREYVVVRRVTTLGARRRRSGGSRDLDRRIVERARVRHLDQPSGAYQQKALRNGVEETPVVRRDE